MQKAHNNSKKSVKHRISVVFWGLLCALCFLLVLASVFVSRIAFSDTPENTAQILGYKLYFCVDDIAGTDIKSGSLLIIKNSNDDEYYTASTLAQNAVLVLDGAGDLLKENGGWIALCLMTPPMLLFVMILLFELKKLFLRRDEIKMNSEFKIVEIGKDA